VRLRHPLVVERLLEDLLRDPHLARHLADRPPGLVRGLDDLGSAVIADVGIERALVGQGRRSCVPKPRPQPRITRPAAKRLLHLWEDTRIGALMRLSPDSAPAPKRVGSMLSVRFGGCARSSFARDAAVPLRMESGALSEILRG
jgi:hypothetical protein